MAEKFWNRIWHTINRSDNSSRTPLPKSNPELLVKTKQAIDQTRLATLYKEMEERGIGCIILTVKALHEYFYPNKPLPRDFEERVRATFPNLNKAGFYDEGALKFERLQLGFKADALLFLREADMFPSTSLIVLLAEKRNPPTYPLAVLMTHPTEPGAHVLPWTGKEISTPFNINHPGGAAEIALFQQLGYQPKYLIHFIKSDLTDQEIYKPFDFTQTRKTDEVDSV